MNLIQSRIKKENQKDFLEFDGGLNIPVPVRQDAEIEEGQDVLMGLRTEEITIAEKDGLIPPEWIFPGLVKVVEPLGNENHLYVEIEGITFVAKCEGRRIVNSGDELKIAFNLEQLHIFDEKTTRVVYQGESTS